MSEYDLIQVAMHFRQLADAIEESDMILSGREELFRMRIAKADAKLSQQGQYESACREIAVSEKERDHITATREAIDRHMAAVKADVDSLVESTRRERAFA